MPTVARPARRAKTNPCPAAFPRVCTEQLRELLELRSCTPEQAPLVRAVAEHDRTVLPRWHQDDRGWNNRTRGHHEQAPAGAYNHIPAWNGRAHWLSVVVPVAIAVHRDLLKREQVSPDTFRLWAKVESLYAQDGRTGRRCIVRPATVAAVMGMHVDVARTCRRIARKLGLQVVIRLGRMLTLNECTAARRRGSRQRGLSTETALTIPAKIGLAVASATPTSGRPSPSPTHLGLSSLHGLAAEQKEAATPPPRPNRPPRGRRPRQAAAELARIVPWLRSERPGRLAPALTRFLTAKTPWSARDIADALEALALRTGRGQIDPTRIRTRPAAVLAALLRQLDPQADHPSAAAFPHPLTPSTPCDRPDCDGHGWLTLTHDTVAKCPACPPSLRTWRDPDQPGAGDLGGELGDDAEPPF